MYVLYINEKNLQWWYCWLLTIYSKYVVMYKKNHPINMTNMPELGQTQPDAASIGYVLVNHGMFVGRL